MSKQLAPWWLAILVAFSASAAPNPERDAYFGETHVHTSWSLDAFAMGNMLTNPGDAYKYFQGQPVKHPLGFDVKIDTPLGNFSAGLRTIWLSDPDGITNYFAQIIRNPVASSTK